MQDAFWHPAPVSGQPVDELALGAGEDIQDRAADARWSTPGIERCAAIRSPPRSLQRDAVGHLGTPDFIAERGNVVFLRPGTGKTHLATGIAIRALPR